MSEMSGRTPVCRMRPFVGTVRTEMSACPGARHASSGSVARPVSRAVVVAGSVSRLAVSRTVVVTVVAGSVSRLAVSRAVVIFVAFGAFVFSGRFLRSGLFCAAMISAVVRFFRT